MEMIAKLENEVINVYNEIDEIIGSIKSNIKPHFNESELRLGDKVYKIIRENWTFKVFDNDEVVYNLKTNSFFGTITVIELNKKIKGVFSLKWGTQLVDEDNNTLLRIRNKNIMINKWNYDIEVLELNVTNFEIILSIFGHMYGSYLNIRAAV